MLHESKIRRFLSEVIDFAQPKRVVLFGSLARGQKRMGDVDLLVIVSDHLTVQEVSACL